jgi:hypothetical protein
MPASLLLLLLLLLSSHVQLSALPQLLQWLSAQNNDSSNELLHNRLDMARVAVAGHSRGGKLAALQFAKGESARHCYIVAYRPLCVAGNTALYAEKADTYCNLGHRPVTNLRGVGVSGFILIVVMWPSWQWPAKAGAASWQPCSLHKVGRQVLLVVVAYSPVCDDSDDTLRRKAATVADMWPSFERILFQILASPLP